MCEYVCVLWHLMCVHAVARRRAHALSASSNEVHACVQLMCEYVCVLWHLMCVHAVARRRAHTLSASSHDVRLLYMCGSVLW